MKILVIQKTTEQDWETSSQIKCEESRRLQEYWKGYKEENLVPFDIEFEFLRGENLCSVGGWTPQWCYFYNEETLMNEIEKRIEEGSIDGILIDPILTEEEEMDYKSCNVIRCNTAERIFCEFSRRVPIGFSIPMVCTSLFEQTDLYREIVGFSIRANHIITPVFHLSNFSMFYSPMFRYYVEAGLGKSVEGSQETGKQKKIEKI